MSTKSVTLKVEHDVSNKLINSKFTLQWLRKLKLLKITFETKFIVNIWEVRDILFRESKTKSLCNHSKNMSYP